MLVRYTLILALVLAAGSPISSRAQPASDVAPLELPDGWVEVTPPGHVADAGTRRVEGPMSPDDVLARLRSPLRAASTSRASGAIEVSLDVPTEVDNLIGVVVPDAGGRITAVGFTTDNVVAVTPEGAPLWTTAVPGCGPYDLDDRGGVVVVGCVRQRRVLVLDAETGGLLRSVSTPGYITKVRLSEDGARAVLGMWGATPAESRLLVLNTATGGTPIEIPAAFQGSGYTVPFVSNRERIFFTPIAISPDGARVALGAFSGLFVFDADTGALVASHAAGWTPDALDMSADGSTLLATFSQNGPIEAVFVDLADGTVTPLPLEGPTSKISAAIAPDGAAALVSVTDEVLMIGPERAPQVVWDAYGLVTPLGQGLAAVDVGSGDDDAVLRVDLVSGATISTSPGHPFSWERRILDGQTYASTHLMEHLDVQDLAQDAPSQRVRVGEAPEPDGARFLALDAAGERAAISFVHSRQVGVYDAEGFERLWLTDIGVDAAGVAFAPSDNEVLVAGGDRLMRLDATTGEVLQSVALRAGNARVLIVEAGRVYVHVRDRPGTVEIYDLAPDGLAFRASAEVLSRLSLSVGAGTVPFVAVSPSGRFVLGIDFLERAIRVYDLDADAVTSVAIGAIARGLAISPDSKRAVVADGQERVHVIDLNDTSSLLTSVTIPQLWPFAIAFDASRDGFWLTTTGSRVGAVLIDPTSGDVQETRTFDAVGFVSDVLWTPETGLAVAVTGALQAYPGTTQSLATLGVLLTEEGAYPLSTAPSQMAGPTQSGKLLAALPGPDGVAVVAGVPVSAEAPPATGLRLRTVAQPARGGARWIVEAPGGVSVRVEVFDALGRVVARLHDGPVAGGTRELRWEASSSGIYVARIAGTEVSARATVVR